jgi:hypothetical protein
MGQTKSIPQLVREQKQTHGTCFLSSGKLTLPEALDKGEALLSMHTAAGCTNYLIKRYSDPDGETVGYGLTKLTQFIADRVVYDIDLVGKDFVCDCPASTFNPSGPCKHARALKNALTRHNLI